MMMMMIRYFWMASCRLIFLVHLGLLSTFAVALLVRILCIALLEICR